MIAAIYLYLHNSGPGHFRLLKTAANLRDHNASSLSIGTSEGSKNEEVYSTVIGGLKHGINFIDT